MKYKHAKSFRHNIGYFKLIETFFFKHTGPLTITDDERNEILIGVASWGYECGSADAPGVYAKVTSVLTWIDDIVFKDNQGKRCVHIVHTH